MSQGSREGAATAPRGGAADAREEILPDLFEEDAAARSIWSRVGLVAAAVCLFVLGIVGWVLPVVTGLPFHFLALVCLGMTSARLARRMNAWERRLPLRWRRLLRPRKLRELLRRRRARRAEERTSG